MIPTQEQILKAAEDWSAAFKTGRWFQILRRDAFEMGANYSKLYAQKVFKAAIIAAVKHGIENCEDLGDKWNDAAAERYYNENYGS